MDSASDESFDFVWTDASYDSSSSESMPKESMNESHSEGESVSGKVFKKQLHDELFARNTGDLPNGEHKHKKRKRKVTDEHSHSEHVPKKKRIKREPESDSEVALVSKTGLARQSEDHSSYDESHLKLQVKAEEHNYQAPSPTKKKKNKKKLKYDSLDENKPALDTAENRFKNKDNKSEDMNEDEDHLNSLVQKEENDLNEKKAKKKKKKSKNRKDLTSEEMSEPKEPSTPASSCPHASPISQDTPNVRTDSYSSHHSDTPAKSVISENRKRKSSNPSVTEEDTLRQPGTPLNRNVSFSVPNDSTKRKTRISDRLQFEEDNSIDLGNDQIQSHITPATRSSKIKSFLKNNLNLKPITRQFDDEAVLTDDDELWIVRCPKEVNISAFLNKDLPLQGKCKIKLDGQPYEGVMDCEGGNVSILSSEHSGFLIQNLPVKGCLNLRKKIPKSYTQVDTITNSLTSFIPLPETKCRHPLFGSNYRKAIKLRSNVAERLKQASSLLSYSPKLSKKKHKTNKSYEDSTDQHNSTPKAEPSPPSLSSVKPELESDHSHPPRNKKKKRKHSESEQIAPKKIKRTKHNLDSAEVWESEQAIEENLFDF